MKRKKFMNLALLIAAAMTLTACSSSEHMYVPYAIYNLEWSYNYNRDPQYGTSTALPGRIGREHEETLENIFDSITVMGVTLSLPMNVSDLPEGLTVTDSDRSAIETCDGKYITYGEIQFGDDIVVCSNVFILREKNRDISRGIIVGYEFGSLPYRSPLVYDSDGHNLLYMTSSEVTELLGETKESRYNRYNYYCLVYTDACGRRAGWRYFGEYDSMYTFTLTAHSALDFLYVI